MSIFNPNIGRRTGVDIKAGKNIKRLANGFEDFDDYWTENSESEADESVASALKVIASPEKDGSDKKNSADKARTKVRSMSPFGTSCSSIESSVRSVRMTTTLQSDETQSEIQEQEPCDNELSNLQRQIEELNAASGTVPTQAEQSQDAPVTDPVTSDTVVEEPKDQHPSSQASCSDDTTTAEDLTTGINPSGEINGTITRGDEEMDFEKAKINSAVSNFRTRKRLTYTSSGAETSPDQPVEKNNKLGGNNQPEFKIPLPLKISKQSSSANEKPQPAAKHIGTASNQAEASADNSAAKGDQVRNNQKETADKVITETGNRPHVESSENESSQTEPDSTSSEMDGNKAKNVDDTVGNVNNETDDRDDESNGSSKPGSPQRHWLDVVQSRPSNPVAKSAEYEAVDGRKSGDEEAGELNHGDEDKSVHEDSFEVISPKSVNQTKKDDTSSSGKEVKQTKTKEVVNDIEKSDTNSKCVDVVIDESSGQKIQEKVSEDDTNSSQIKVKRTQRGRPPKQKVKHVEEAKQDKGGTSEKMPSSRGSSKERSDDIDGDNVPRDGQKNAVENSEVTSTRSTRNKKPAQVNDTESQKDKISSDGDKLSEKKLQSVENENVLPVKRSHNTRRAKTKTVEVAEQPALEPKSSRKKALSNASSNASQVSENSKTSSKQRKPPVKQPVGRGRKKNVTNKKQDAMTSFSSDTEASELVDVVVGSLHFISQDTQTESDGGSEDLASRNITDAESDGEKVPTTAAEEESTQEETTPAAAAPQLSTIVENDTAEKAVIEEQSPNTAEEITTQKEDVITDPTNNTAAVSRGDQNSTNASQKDGEESDEDDFEIFESRMSLKTIMTNKKRMSSQSSGSEIEAKKTGGNKSPPKKSRNADTPAQKGGKRNAGNAAINRKEVRPGGRLSSESGNDADVSLNKELSLVENNQKNNKKRTENYESEEEMENEARKVKNKKYVKSKGEGVNKGKKRGIRKAGQDEDSSSSHSEDEDAASKRIKQPEKKKGDKLRGNKQGGKNTVSYVGFADKGISDLSDCSVRVERLPPKTKYLFVSEDEMSEDGSLLKNKGKTKNKKQVETVLEQVIDNGIEVEATSAGTNNENKVDKVIKVGPKGKGRNKKVKNNGNSEKESADTESSGKDADEREQVQSKGKNTGKNMKAVKQKTDQIIDKQSDSDDRPQKQKALVAKLSNQRKGSKYDVSQSNIIEENTNKETNTQNVVGKNDDVIRNDDNQQKKKALVAKPSNHRKGSKYDVSRSNIIDESKNKETKNQNVVGENDDVIKNDDNQQKKKALVAKPSNQRKGSKFNVSLSNIIEENTNTETNNQNVVDKSDDVIKSKKFTESKNKYDTVVPVATSKKRRSKYDITLSNIIEHPSPTEKHPSPEPKITKKIEHPKPTEKQSPDGPEPKITKQTESNKIKMPMKNNKKLKQLATTKLKQTKKAKKGIHTSVLEVPGTQARSKSNKHVQKEVEEKQVKLTRRKMTPKNVELEEEEVISEDEDVQSTSQYSTAGLSVTRNLMESEFSTPSTVTKRARKRRIITSPLSEAENEAVAYTSGSTTIDEFNKQQSTSASVGYSPLQSSQSSAATASGLRRGKTSVSAVEFDDEEEEEEESESSTEPDEADDEMASPPAPKRAKKLIPRRSKGNSTRSFSAGSGDDEDDSAAQGSDSDDGDVSEGEERTPLSPALPEPKTKTTPRSILKKGNRQRIKRLSSLDTGEEDVRVSPTTAPSKSPNRRQSAAVVHFNEVTTSQTPAGRHLAPLQKKEVKIIVPSQTDSDAVRRSQRTRVKPLDWFRGERVVYKRRQSGGFAICDVLPPYMFEEEQALKRQKQLHTKGKGVKQARKRVKYNKPVTPSELSIHASLSPHSEYEMCEDSTVPVINPHLKEEVLVECMKHKRHCEFKTPSGEDPTENDPLVISKFLKQKAFSLGMLIIRPLDEKSTQFVRKDTMVFIVKYGKVAVTIHRTTAIHETDDVFFVPQGNTYSIKNLRKDEAKLWFFQHKGEAANPPKSPTQQ